MNRTIGVDGAVHEYSKVAKVVVKREKQPLSHGGIAKAKFLVTNLLRSAFSHQTCLPAQLANAAH